MMGLGQSFTGSGAPRRLTAKRGLGRMCFPSVMQLIVDKPPTASSITVRSKLMGTVSET